MCFSVLSVGLIKANAVTNYQTFTDSFANPLVFVIVSKFSENSVLEKLHLR